MNLFYKTLLLLIISLPTTIVLAHPEAEELPINLSPISGEVLTVKEALNSRDDTYVKLTGKLIKRVGHELYQFQDKTGSILVDIDDDLWFGRNIGTKTNVTIWGEVDVDYTPLRKVEIDVYQIEATR